MVETNDGKKIDSAMVMITTKHEQALSHNSGYKGVSFRMKFEGKEGEADEEQTPNRNPTGFNKGKS